MGSGTVQEGPGTLGDGCRGAAYARGCDLIGVSSELKVLVFLVARRCGEEQYKADECVE